MRLFQAVSVTSSLVNFFDSKPTVKIEFMKCESLIVNDVCRKTALLVCL